MSATTEDDPIDQEDFDEFTGVSNHVDFEEVVLPEPNDAVSARPKITSLWQTPVDHTFEKYHFKKVTHCPYNILEVPKMSF